MTADNYVVGKVSSFGHNYHIYGIYGVNNNSPFRVKVPLGGGPAIALNQDELRQFPENYEFQIPHFHARQN